MDVVIVEVFMKDDFGNSNMSPMNNIHMYDVANNRASK